MLLHKIKTAFRTLRREQLYTSLNLAGLTIGMATAMLIALWTQNELRFDAFHRNADHIWRVKTDLKIDDTETWHWGTVPMKIPALTANIPGVAQTVQALFSASSSLDLQRGASLFNEKKFAYVGPGWFDVFDYEFAEGNAAGFGERANDLLLSESLAHKLFGDKSALGQVLKIDSTNFSVHAVFRDPRPASSFRENLLLPLEAHLRKGNNRENDEQWNNYNYTTFLDCYPDAQPDKIADVLTTEIRKIREDSATTFLLSPLKEVHYDTSIKGDVFEKGSMQLVWIFGCIGMLILLMAAINYVSLSTARAQARAKTVGIYKVVGANRWQLFTQFLTESLLLSFGAGLMALLLVQAVLPHFNEFAGSNFSLPLNSPIQWVLFGGTLFFTVLLAGIYPAQLLAGFKPLEVISGKGKSNLTHPVLRQGLVVLQFFISVALLICTLVIGQQRSFIANKAMGYDREQIFSFQIGWMQQHALGAERAGSLMQAFEQNLRNNAAVTGLSVANGSPVHIVSTHSGSIHFDGLPEDAEPTVSVLSTDAHFADLFHLKMAEGRWFEANNSSDKDNFILNETAAAKLGLPQPWLHQPFEMHDRKGQVIGIVKDFHFQSLHESVSPLVISTGSGWMGEFFVQTRPGMTAQALAAAEQTWQEFFPGQTFAYTFLDDAFDKMYRQEKRAGLLFYIFSGLAIFISCLGLFGLATFVTVQRNKEIGIRKVLGASVAGITGLLARDFLKLVLLAIVMATPIAWYLMNLWLADFAYRIEMQWWMFAAAGLLAVVIAFLTVGGQAVKAALTNPVKSLRSE